MWESGYRLLAGKLPRYRGRCRKQKHHQEFGSGLYLVPPMLPTADDIYLGILQATPHVINDLTRAGEEREAPELLLEGAHRVPNQDGLKSLNHAPALRQV